MSFECLTTLPDIDPEEERVLTFDFTNGLPPGEMITGATTKVSVTGTDPLPSTRFSSPQLDGNKVKVAVEGCLSGNKYHLRIIAPTNDPHETPVAAFDLTCKRF